jgi:uncharacterized membrane protein
VQAYVLDWLNLLVRWTHVTVAIAWIGTSFYYIALDYALLPPAAASSKEVGGEAWEIHGGGFYRVEKYKVAPPSLPAHLHWFKWEAYWTWISGFSLLVVLYYANAQSYLIDPSVADLSPAQAIGISLGILAVGWLVYEALGRLIGDNDYLFTLAIGAFIALVAFTTSRVLSPRGTYIEVGAMIGTWMAANVFLIIIPGQRELVAAKAAGREPDPRPGILGKQRSVHNNYFTLPVLFAMLSNHFPMTYAHPAGWLILLALMGLGAWVRHYFNLRHQGRTVWAIPASAAAGVAVLALAIAPRSTPQTTTASGSVAFAEVQPIVSLRCVPCHSATPTNSAVSSAPRGIMFDTPQQIQARATDIYQQAVVTRNMPLGNATGMSQAERDTLAAWIEQGATLK